VFRGWGCARVSKVQRLKRLFCCQMLFSIYKCQRAIYLLSPAGQDEPEKPENSSRITAPGAG
jgi:hypothetical protein